MGINYSQMCQANDSCTLAAYFGLEEAMKAYSRRDTIQTQGYLWFTTAVCGRQGMGHEVVVKLLLENGAELDL